MGRGFNGWVVLALLGLGVAAAPAQARDRKSGSEREARSEIIASRTAARSGATEMSSASRNGKPIAPLADQQVPRSNPLRFNLGAVTLQPAVGGIKGAQFSIGF